MVYTVRWTMPLTLLASALAAYGTTRARARKTG
jgi:hypothetical protein